MSFLLEWLIVSPFGVFFMFLFDYVCFCLVLDLLRMILLIFWGIWKVRIEAGTVNYCKAFPSQPKIVHHILGALTFGMSIAGIRHVDSWGVAHPLGVPMFGMSIAGIRHVDSWSVVLLTSVYVIEASEHWSINGSYVLWSIVIPLLSGMLAQFGSLGKFSKLFLVSRTFKFIMLNDQKTIYLFFNLVVVTVGSLSRWLILYWFGSVI